METKKYMICYPGGGVVDMFSVITNCLLYAIAHNRILVIDTRRIEWFRESIHEFINFRHANVFKEDLDTLLESLNNETTFPHEVKGHLLTFQATFNQELNCNLFNNSINTKLDLTKDYEETVIVFSNRAWNRDYTIIGCVQFKEPVLKVYKERRAKLPDTYVGVHIRNTDYPSDVPQFIAEHESILKERFFLASDNRQTIEDMKQRFGDNVITFSHIANNPSGKGLHYSVERNPEEHRQFIIDSYVDLLLLASAEKVVFSCIRSGFSQFANIMAGQKQYLQAMLSM